MSPPSRRAAAAKPRKTGAEMQKRTLDSFYAWLDHPIHASSLCVFRMVYAYVMLAQVMKWADMFDRFQASIYTLHYPGVWWILPVSPALGKLMLGVMFVCSIGLGIGFMTRTMATMNFVLFAYVFHICHSNYNNHYVLMCHINFVGCFMDWGTWGSVDAFLMRRFGKPMKSTVPRWHLWLMQLLFCVPYFWGSVAKMNSDWLFRAQPLIMWFSPRPGWFYQQWWFPWFIAWSGMMYDLLISFLLLWKKTRFLLGFPGAIFFNLGNKLMFNIGVFPMAMVASLVLFLDPDHPAKWWKALTISPNAPPSPRPAAKEKEMTESYTAEDNDDKERRPRSGSKWRKRYVLIYVLGFLIFHTLYPLRHFALYKSNPSWTEEGHTGAWHMKLRSKRGNVHLEFVGHDGTTVQLCPRVDPFVSKNQLKKIETRPEDILTYAARLKQVFEEAGYRITEIHAYSCFALNDNPPRELYIPTANLVDYIGKYELIGVSAVDKWVYAYKDAPLCDDTSSPFLTKQARTENEEAFRQLYHQANLYRAAELGLQNSRRWPIFHTTNKETKSGLVPGYMWNL